MSGFDINFIDINKLAMKNFRFSIFTIWMLIVFLFSNCETSSINDIDPSQKHESIIIGLKKSIQLEILNNGRVDSIPENINNLSIIIANENLQPVYQNNYYGYNYWDLYHAIPDSIFIPPLAEGNYTLMAVTLDYYGYYDQVFSDSVEISSFIIEPYYFSSGVIYAGRSEFTLTEENQLVAISMQNISSRIDLRLKEGQELHGSNLGIILNSKEGSSYDLFHGNYLDFRSDWPISYYSYLGEQYYYNENGGYTEDIHSTSLYILPSKINQITFDYWDYSGNYFSYSIELEEVLALNSNDKISIVIDLDEILNGAGSGVFDWEDVQWTDKGELTIP